MTAPDRRFRFLRRRGADGDAWHAVELARHRVRCNAILPGWTETEMIEPGLANERWVDAIIRRTPVRRWGWRSSARPPSRCADR